MANTAKPARNFGRPRLSRDALKFTLSTPAFRGSAFQPLPTPTGPAPYHLNLADVIDKKLHKAIVDKGKMVFQISGDNRAGRKHPTRTRRVGWVGGRGRVE